MPKLLGGSPDPPMKPNKMTKKVVFFNGKTLTMPRNWQAMLTGGYPGDERTIVMKKFPPKTELHPEPLSDDEKSKSLEAAFQVKVPTVTATFFTSDDDGSAYYNIMESIVGSYPRRGHDYGDEIIKSKGEIRGSDMTGAVKCALQSMNYFTMNSPKIFDKKIVLSRTEEELKACLVGERSSAKFEIKIPDRWKK